MSNLRTFTVRVFGRKTTEPINNLFLMQPNVKNPLNLGFFALLPREVTGVVNALSQQKLQVTSISPFSLYAHPNVVNVYIQSQESALIFAKKVRRVLNTLTMLVPSIPEPPPPPAFRLLCQAFSQIIGAQTVGIIGESCEVLRFRNIPFRVNGKPVSTDGLSYFNLGFENVDKQGKALCTGTVGLLRREVSPFINVLRKQKSIKYSPLFTRYFTNPTLHYLNYTAVERPLDFAKISRQAISVL
ncbi:DUF1259 domain-containing protein [Marininema halotolerans]|uniref:Uncharacterized protein n=1 Tax=Marininema halotolerans TaxID=1155944 RepID=A0A1I6U2A4_9BACL|nr:DUF1259 domain-containing protein [Marininema halotolerans]SFS95504.1 protein of unknown function [Marininema halotolerans]